MDKTDRVELKRIEFDNITWCGINNERSNIVGIIADLHTYLPENLATKSTLKFARDKKLKKLAAQRLASTSPIAFDEHNNNRFNSTPRNIRNTHNNLHSHNPLVQSHLSTST